MTDLNQRFYNHRQCLNPNTLNLREILGNNPNFCECARVGYRSLSWDKNPKSYEPSNFRQKYNKEFYHQHIKFDQSRDNIGFYGDGIKGKLFYEDTSKYNYTWDDKCYNGSIMRQAIADTNPPKWYLFIMRNCQTYVDLVLNNYNRFLGR